MKASVVYYGAGNTRSVCAALRAVGVASEVTDQPDRLRSSEWVILPGVGSANAAMTRLRETGADVALRDRVAAGGPTLGICLGLQLAMAESEEDGGVVTLGIVPGVTRRLTGPRLPRLGWESVTPRGEAFYFAHGYYVDSPYATAVAEGVTAEVAYQSFLGVQYHPEKSGRAGLELLDLCRSLV